MNEKKLKDSLNLFYIALGADIAATLVIGASAFWAIGALSDAQAGIRDVSWSFIETLEYWDKFSMLAIITLICVGLALVNWLNSCYRFAEESIGVTGFKHKGWAAAGWVVPFMNLYIPYQIVNEIYKAGSPVCRSADDWKDQRGSGLLLAWWIFWVISHCVMWALSKAILGNSFDDNTTFSQVIGIYQIKAWVCFISFIVAGLWFVVAKDLTKRLISRSPLNSEESSNCGELTAEELTTEAIATPVENDATSLSSTPQSDPPFNPLENQYEAHDTALDEEAIYATIATEIETGKTDRGLWTKMFVECDGDENRTKVAYIKRRAERLIAATARTDGGSNIRQD